MVKIMYAICVINKKEFLLHIGDKFFINNINGIINDNIEFNTIKLLKLDNNLFIGKPYLNNVKIIAKLISVKKTKKIVVIKFKRRKNYLRSYGHRQMLMEFLVVNIIKENNYGT